jgi:hypothetical protein
MRRERCRSRLRCSEKTECVCRDLEMASPAPTPYPYSPSLSDQSGRQKGFLLSSSRKKDKRGKKKCALDRVVHLFRVTG